MTSQLYGSHHTGHHLPAIYYTYAAALAPFGDSGLSIPLLLLLWTIPAVYLLYRLGLLVLDRPAAGLAALFYAVLTATGPYRRIFGPQTELIIVDAHRQPPPPGWLYEELTRRYTLETIIDEQAIYRRQ